MSYRIIGTTKTNECMSLLGENMKFCKTCAHYSPREIGGSYVFICNYSAKNNEPDLVTGEKAEFSLFNECRVQRNHEHLCGKKGNWFQPKSE